MRSFVSKYQLLVAIVPMLNVGLAGATEQGARSSTRSSRTSSSSASSSSITCEMEMTDYLYSTVEDFEATRLVEDEWSCVDDSDIVHGLSGSWSRIFDEFEVEPGVTNLRFQNVTITQPGSENHEIPTIVVHDYSTIALFQGENRNDSTSTNNSTSTSTNTGRKLRVPSSGELEVLVVRITDAASQQPRLNGKDISDRVFSTTGDSESLKTQLEACSGDQLQLNPSTRNTDIVAGILELQIAVSVSDYSHSERKDLENVINRQLKGDGYRVQSFGLVLYIMPETSNLGVHVLGYAYVGGKKSVYRGVPSFQTFIHEIGHNLGLAHSGLEDDTSYFRREYGDLTCQMGYSTPLNYYDYPQKCFNGPKSFDLGWYNSETKIGHEVIDSLSSWRGKLAGVHDYYGEQYNGVQCGGDRFVAKISSLYILFNRAEDQTKDVHNPNTVIVYERVIENNKAYSRLKVGGVLSKNDIGTFETTAGESFTVKVCDISFDNTNPSIMDYADVIIFRNDDGSIVKSCDVEPPTNTCSVPLPSASPSASPTAGPTASPSASKTASPIASPSASPSGSPTAGPTASPSAIHSDGPTAGPTASPSAIHSAGPTAGPTASPSASPTAGPTATPSAVHSDGPTAGPTASPSASPTAGPTAGPTASPSASITASPSSRPSPRPSYLRSTSPPGCTPSEAVLISNDQNTNFDRGSLPIRITSQNTTHVRFKVVNTFGTTLTSLFTVYTTGTFGHEECPENNNVQSLHAFDEYSARCSVDEPRAIVKIYVEDGGRELFGEGTNSNAVVPKCCHQTRASQESGNPIAMYAFLLSCIDSCTGISTVE